MHQGDALELAKILQESFLAFVEEWGMPPAYLVVNPKIFSIQGVETANVFHQMFLNNRRLVQFGGCEVLKSEFLTEGVYPFKFVK